jgi:hypothetical protein
MSEDEENPEVGGSTTNIKFCVEDNEVLEGENNDSANPEAFSADHRTLADELIDTAESNHDNDADCAPFVHAAPKKTSAQPPKRPSAALRTKMTCSICKFLLLFPKLLCILLFILTIHMLVAMRAL